MDLAVTIGAAPVKEKNRVLPAGGHRMHRTHMALRAKSRIGNFEQPVIDGPVRLMTVGATVKDRRMDIEKGSPPLRVTTPTVFIHASLFKLVGIGSAVRVVAVGAGHLAFSERHMGRAIELRIALQVTLAANFDFCSLIVKDGSFAEFAELKTVSGFLHDGVAVHAGDSPVRVRACLPIGLNTLLMPPQADPGLNLCRLS